MQPTGDEELLDSAEKSILGKMKKGPGGDVVSD